MGRVLLIDVDATGYPNLALMKWSAYFKSLGYAVRLQVGDDYDSRFKPDLIKVSCIFTRNGPQAQGMERLFPNVEVGGYGANLKQLLPEVEHIMPDYSLYDVDYCVGFTSRGCIRACPWCVVPKAEGRMRDNAPITEFYRPDFGKLILYDNNFLASPRFEENMDYLIENKVKVCFNQANDIRLVNDENAELLAKVDYRDDQFKTKRHYFAFDTPEIENDVLRGISTLKKVGIKPQHLMFYVLVGFDTTYEEDIHRIKVLLKEKALPYVMCYNERADLYYPDLKRWMNYGFYRFINWEDYDYADSQIQIRRQERGEPCSPATCKREELG